MSEKTETFVVDLPEPRRQARSGQTALRTSQKSRTKTKVKATAKGYARRISGERIRSKRALKTIFLEQRGTRRPSVFVSWKAQDLASLAEVAHEEKGNLRLLVLEELSPARKEYLQTLFRTVVSPGRSLCLLPWEELVRAVSAENRDEVFVAGVLNEEEQVVVLYRGTFDRLSIPFSWFRRESALEPDFTDFELIDHGQTIRFGSFEASADAILYDFDAAYRARAKKRQLELDDSFGGSLRRLRELKGLRRSDFPSISAKEIARIERSEVSEPREETIKAIARRLGVSLEEINDY